MISLPIKDMQGKEVGSYELDPTEFAPRVNKQLLHDVVVMYAANRRQGTVRTRSRGDVRGTTKKLYRQKGTGRARAGMRSSPVRRGGGHTFAKVNKDWSYRLPKKAVRTATRMALLSKFLDDEVTVLSELTLAEPKTRHVASCLDSLDLTRVSCLLAVAEHDPLVWRSSRNISNLWVSPAADLNAYKLLHQKQLLVTTAALDLLRQGLPGSWAGADADAESDAEAS